MCSTVGSICRVQWDMQSDRHVQHGRCISLWPYANNVKCMCTSDPSHMLISVSSYACKHKCILTSMSSYIHTNIHGVLCMCHTEIQTDNDACLPTYTHTYLHTYIHIYIHLSWE